MAETLKVGIIGMGAIGNVHADAIKPIEGMEVTAVCDVFEDKVEAARQRHGVSQGFTDYRDLLKTDVDAVFVAMGNARHCETAVAALEAGKHVFLQKPMAMDAQEAQRIVDKAAGTDRLLQIGMVLRFSAQAQAIKEAVEKGLLGDIYRIRWVMTRRRGIPGLGRWFTTKDKSGGGPMIDLGVHWFDLSMHLSGNWRPRSVSAASYAKFGPRMEDYTYVGMWAGPPDFTGVYDVEDYAAGFVRFENEMTLSFDVSWAANTEGDSYMELLGDRGGIRITAFEDKPLKIITEHAGRVADIEWKYAAGGNMYEAEARGFLSACRGEQPVLPTGEQGVTVMKIIDAIRASSEQGREVAVE